MTDDEKETGLLGSAIFQDLPEEHLGEIARAVRTEVVPPGHIICRQGDPGDSFYIINSGKVRVFLRGAEGAETELSVLGPGDSFGEMALLTGEPRSANVQAVGETRLTVLPKDEFDRILASHPDVSLTFVRQMSKWLLRADTKLDLEAQQEARARRVTFLDILLIGGLTVLCGLLFNLSNPNGLPLMATSLSGEPVATVSAASAMSQEESHQALFVDARPSYFFDEEHIPGAVNMPMTIFEVSYMMAMKAINDAESIIVYGSTVSRLYDEEVARQLILRGHDNVRILEGGLSAWKKNGYPIEKP